MTQKDRPSLASSYRYSSICFTTGGPFVRHYGCHKQQITNKVRIGVALLLALWPKSAISDNFFFQIISFHPIWTSRCSSACVAAFGLNHVLDIIRHGWDQLGTDLLLETIPVTLESVSEIFLTSFNWFIRASQSSIYSFKTYSIGFNSGVWTRQSRNHSFFSMNHSFVCPIVCLGALSRWNTKSGTCRLYRVKVCIISSSRILRWSSSSSLLMHQSSRFLETWLSPWPWCCQRQIWL